MVILPIIRPFRTLTLETRGRLCRTKGRLLGGAVGGAVDWPHG